MDRYRLKFLIPPHFVDFDLLQPMGPKNRGGGTALKYARVQEAAAPHFKCDRVGSTDDVDPGDIVFADWMWFCVTEDDTQPIDRVKHFLEMPNIKIVYGSEFCVVKMPFKLIQEIVDSAEMVLHNSIHLRNFYRIIGIYDSCFLSDPVPPIFMPSIAKKPRLVCMGQISEAKNTQAAVSVFEGLKGTGIERVFLGGKSLWGQEFANMRATYLQNAIESASDLFIENATQNEVAKICNESTFYGHYAFHDVSSYSGQENMSAGNIMFGLGHPILKERTDYRFDTVESLTEAIANYSLDAEQYQTDLKRTLEMAEQWSYESWHNQMSIILGRLF